MIDNGHGYPSEQRKHFIFQDSCSVATAVAPNCYDQFPEQHHFYL